MYRSIIGKMPKKVKKTVKNFIFTRRYNRMLKKLNDSKIEDSTIYVIGAPEHGNLGDHAIMDAELKFLKDHFSNYRVVEIPYNMIFLKLNELKDLIKKEDIVCVTGGGYMGSLWPRSEEFVRKIVTNFLENKVIVFPQTAYYETNSPKAVAYLNDSVDIYNSHNDLTLTAREKSTYNLFQKHYTNSNNILTPDIGLYLNETNKAIQRDGILVCLRSDREKVTDTSNLMELVKRKANKFNLEITETDTVLHRPVFREQRENLLQKKLDEFRSAKIVVTDRLHGMIFAVVTSTPCIALDNKTGKVKGVYSWIEDQNYITLLDDLNNFDEQFQRLIDIKDPTYEFETIFEKFEPLLDSFKISKD